VNAKTILVFLAVMFSVLCATLWQMDRHQQEQETTAALKALEHHAIASRAEADSAIAQADLRAHLDSLSWRDYLADVLAHTKASDRDSAQRAVNQAVRRARQEVLAAIGNPNPVVPDSSSDSIAVDTSCRVWSTCQDDGYRRAADSLLRWRIDSLREAQPVQAKSCSAAVAQTRFETASNTPSTGFNRWMYLGAGILAGIVTGVIIH
jgi:hypothetical protein